jgi:protein involved in polysaccharide export with SLBB domain
VTPPKEAEANAPYRFTGGEKIKLVVPLSVGESLEQVVSDDGYIALPLGGVVNIKGKTIPEAQAAALDGLSAHSENRKISIALAILEYPIRRVYVGGEVKKPQMIALTAGTPLYLAGALAGAEGGTPEAELSRVRLVRTNLDGSRKTIIYDASNLSRLRNGSETSDVGPELRSGDVITVPRSVVFFLAGEVAKPGAVNRKELFLNSGEAARFTRVLFAGGGLKLSANRKELKLIRTGPNGAKEVLIVNLDDAIKSHSNPAQNEVDSDPLLQDGDISFTDYAKASSVSVIRASDPKTVIRINVTSITKEGNSELDLELNDGDLVFVGERIL